MNDYPHYKPEDFMTDPDFIRWVFEKKPEDDFFWQQWLIKYPEKRSAIEEAVLILRSLKIAEPQMDEESVQENISALVGTAQKQSAKKTVSISRFVKYAAIFLIVAGVGIGIAYLAGPYHQQPGIGATADQYMPPKSSEIVEEANNTAAQKIIHLQDGSTISLSPGAVIRYASELSAGKTRDIYLSGEAFFEVAKNPQKPFRVFSHDLITKVLGTSFFIKANPKDDTISVIVKTGKVSVYNNKNDTVDINSNRLTGVVLTPNQQLSYSRNALTFQKTLIEKPMLIHPSEIKNDFQYEDVPVAEVLEQLKKAFGIDISYDKEAIKNCRITADLIDESIYKKLELICKAMDAKYDVIDGQVTIDAKPCEPMR